MTHLLAFLLCLPGFAALAMATERQQDIHLGRPLAAKTTRHLRLAGVTALVLALAVVVAGQGWAMGLVSYSGHTSLCAGLVFLALLGRERYRTARPRR
jgi:hypothetical protein